MLIASLPVFVPFVVYPYNTFNIRFLLDKYIQKGKLVQFVQFHSRIIHFSFYSTASGFSSTSILPLVAFEYGHA